MLTSVACPIHMRWIIRRDLDTLLYIERMSFEYAWGEKDFVAALAQRNSIGFVAEILETEQIIGFVIYELNKTSVALINLAVHPDFRRRGVGMQITNKLKGKLSHQKRNRLVAHVRESNLPTHLYFKSQGFRAVSVLPKFYQDSGEDAYKFCYRLPLECRRAKSE